MKRSEVDQKYLWDFSNLYSDRLSWEKDLKVVEELGKQTITYKGKLSNFADFKAFEELDLQMDILLNKLVIYLHLGDVDQTNTLYQEMEGMLTNVFQEIQINSAFVAPELKKIGKDKVFAFLDQDPSLERYRLGYENFFEQEKHILDAHDEELLSKVARSRGAIHDLYDSLAYADNQEEKVSYLGEEVPVTTTFLMKILEDSDPIKDQEFRKTVVKLHNKGIVDKKHSFGKVYDGIMQSEVESCNLRGYESVLEANLSGDHVSPSIYLKLLEVGKKYIKPFRDYNLILKKAFKLEKFYPTDRQLKLVSEYNKTFSVEEAQEIIVNSLSVLGDEYLKNLKKAWAPHRIDYYEDTNKRTGAYSTGGNGVDPIILMNWDDKLNSVTTLAHESGHSVHTLFAEQTQPYPLSEYPIILAEVASTINEHLVYDYLIKNAKTKEEKIYLLQQRIFDLVSTFYRQIQFADFEYQAHKQVEDQTPQTAESLAKLFSKIQNDYGYDVFDSEEDVEKLPYSWPKVSHFFHSPFYVYKYAIDVTVSFKLYQDLKEGNVKTTLNFLKAGGSKNPLEVMKDAGIDFNDEKTYQPLIKAMSDMVRELESLVND